MVPLPPLSSSGADCHTFVVPDTTHIVILDFEYIENRNEEEFVIAIFGYAWNLTSGHHFALQKHSFFARKRHVR